jgi:transglutaminase-like putative cysteine protease
LTPYLGSSPFIETRHPKIVELSRRAGSGKDGWEKVEAIYDLTREKVEYKAGELKGAAKALIDGSGDCEELTSLFIALCRNNKIPARMVWVQGHCYPEFYLVDGKNQGHWFPCQAAGTRAFGGIPEHRPILQKGDNFRDPDRPKEPLRYVNEFMTGSAVKGGGKPRVEFVREMVE